MYLYRLAIIFCPFGSIYKGPISSPQKQLYTPTDFLPLLNVSRKFFVAYSSFLLSSLVIQNILKSSSI